MKKPFVMNFIFYKNLQYSSLDAMNIKTFVLQVCEYKKIWNILSIVDYLCPSWWIFSSKKEQILIITAV